MMIKSLKWQALVLAVSCIASTSAWADELRPSPSEVAASGIEARAKESPAIKAARDSQPSEIRPDSRPVPQIAIPLRRGVRQTTSSSGDAAPVDDDVARCIAMKSRAERRDCLVRRPG